VWRVYGGAVAVILGIAAFIEAHGRLSGVVLVIGAGGYG
jgi:hypothetical protein